MFNRFLTWSIYNWTLDQHPKPASHTIFLTSADANPFSIHALTRYFDAVLHSSNFPTALRKSCWSHLQNISRLLPLLISIATALVQAPIVLGLGSLCCLLTGLLFPPACFTSPPILYQVTRMDTLLNLRLSDYVTSAFKTHPMVSPMKLNLYRDP